LTKTERKGGDRGESARRNETKPRSRTTNQAKTLATVALGRHGSKPLQEILGERRVQGLRINLESMALVSNIHRASMFIRDHFERTVLEEAELHWSAFVTLWCLWIYGELETRRLAVEAGIAKSTLSSILNMLEGRRLVRRRTNELERRLVIVNLTAQGAELIARLFPKFNAEETRIVARLSPRQMQAATDAIRVILATINDLDGLTPEE
jgi:DNA-binding MarR family transcriptional regulator